ncbi:MAG: hypothetical protein V1903_11415 [Bacteroidota bacterium]
MKKSVLFIAVLCLLCSNPLTAQGNLLKKVAGAMKDELLGTGGKSSKQEAEPACECDQPETVLDMGGKFKLDYKELEITTMDDGSFLAQDRRSGDYYIIKGGVTQGPYNEGDPRIAGYVNYDEDEDYMEGLVQRYKGIVSKSGNKYNITLGGQTFGPYASIQNFTLSLSLDKFACLVMDEVLATEAEGKKIEEAMEKAKTDQERMELAMKFSQQISDKMMQGGGPQSTMPKLVTNVPDATIDMYSGEMSNLVGNAKFDEILAVNFQNIRNLQGKTIMKMTQEMFGSDRYFINSSNSKNAYFNYGTLTFSDGKTLTDCFNPHLAKTGGQVYLVYMYYSPKRNAIVQCNIPW